ncbi:hypothetical protein HQ520_17545, partial [bacterium]|nr:hypothetical protein [bacterium]
HEGEFDEARCIILAELDHVTDRQGTWRKEDPERDEFRAQCSTYLDTLRDKGLADFPNLFLTAAFIDRDRSDSTSQKGGASA